MIQWTIFYDTLPVCKHITHIKNFLRQTATQYLLTNIYTQERLGRWFGMNIGSGLRDNDSLVSTLATEQQSCGGSHWHPRKIAFRLPFLAPLAVEQPSLATKPSLQPAYANRNYS